MKYRRSDYGEITNEQLGLLDRGLNRGTIKSYSTDHDGTFYVNLTIKGWIMRYLGKIFILLGV